jgi:putative PIN family toxin of toxin-antitoxin system
VKKTDLFVFDVNTLVSAFLVGSHTNDLAFRKAITQGRLITTSTIREELNNVFLRRKFDRYASPEARLDFLANLDRQQIELPEPEEVISACRDPKDNKYLELAVAAKASAIVTGDKDLLTLHPFRGIPILNASDFLNSF